MVEAKHTELLAQILGLADTACQACLELMQQFDQGDVNGSAALLADLRAAAEAVSEAQKPLLPQLEHAYTAEMLENIMDTLDNIEDAITAGKAGRAAVKMEFQLFPFLRLLKEAFYFWGGIFPDEDRMAQYYREEFAAHYQNFYLQEGEKPACKLSIAVTGYNHLETTKQCVEQLLKETDFKKLDAELILIDHGSSDGTLEYFESLGVGKVIRFKKNVRMYMFAALAQICQGEYFCFVSNDILVTRNWADILLQCFESDPDIIAAVPATPNIAHLQMLNAPTKDPKKFIAWANEQNKSDPSRWNDRARLMPPLGMYRAEAVNKLVFVDPYFYSMEFWDDDFSLRARRAGYRQLICGDVACYHFGSVTTSKAQQVEDTLNYGRELFKRRHGVDAWGIGFCYDIQVIQLLKNFIPPQGDVDFLGIDCGFGDTPLQLRNELRRQQRGCKLYQLTAQPEYLPDLTPLSDEARLVSRLTEAVASEFEGVRFSAAFLGRDIGCYEDFPELLAEISERLKPGGVLVFACNNPYFAINIHALLQFSMPAGTARLTLVNPEKVREEAEKWFSNVQTAAVEQPVGGLEDFAKRLFGKAKELPQIVKRMSAQTYYFVCKK